MENDISEIKGWLGRLEADLAQFHVTLAEQSLASLTSTRESPASRNVSTSSKARYQSPVQQLKGSNPCH
jgi:hypothetical protein